MPYFLYVSFSAAILPFHKGSAVERVNKPVFVNTSRRDFNWNNIVPMEDNNIVLYSEEEVMRIGRRANKLAQQKAERLPFTFCFQKVDL